MTAEHDYRWDIIIAHAGADGPLAEQLCEQLAARTRVFLDSRCLQLGDEWDSELAAAQKASVVTVVLVSDHTDGAYYQRGDRGRDRDGAEEQGVWLDQPGVSLKYRSWSPSRPVETERIRRAK